MIYPEIPAFLRRNVHVVFCCIIASMPLIEARRRRPHATPNIAVSTAVTPPAPASYMTPDVNQATAAIQEMPTPPASYTQEDRSPLAEAPADQSSIIERESLDIPALTSRMAQAPAYSPDDMQIDRFLRPVKCTANGIRCFIKNIYNAPEYRHDILPACMAHITDMHTYAAAQDLPLSFDERALQLFHTKLLTCSWVNPYALLVLMEDMPRLLSPRMQHSRAAQLGQIETTLHDALLHEFDELKRNPQHFLESTSARIYDAVRTTAGQRDLEKLQYTCTRFIEHALSKLIWDPRDQKCIWESVCMIAEHLQTWYLFGLLPDLATYNSCLWALLGRFSYFVECTGSQLYPTTYQYMLENLERGEHAWLNIQELEQWITPKKAFIEQCIEQGIIKQRAAAAGIMTDRAF